jgi:PAS domain S-box-containing protein
MNPPKIKNYRIEKLLHRTNNYNIYTAIKISENKKVIIKEPHDNFPNSLSVAQLTNEFEMGKIFHHDNIIGYIDLIHKDTLVFLVKEFFESSSLEEYISKKDIDSEDFLKIALQITEGISDIHRNNLIHKLIKPSNILINPETKQVKISDFSRAAYNYETKSDIQNFIDSIAYISPEQTGRMNRMLDYRTDFYSLGITFYEMLTGRLPFDTNDPMEMVHFHIAKQATSPHHIDAKIPKMISQIVIKLIAKMVEERYQSAHGMKNDLTRCLNKLHSTGTIELFPVGLKDFTDKLRISQKLYGREQETGALLAAFERVSAGSTELILVAGYAGIGKTVLVNEVHKPIVEKRGYFISGKFDQYTRNIPYSAIALAFGSLIRQLLTEPDESLQQWKDQLVTALGSNGQVISDIIPELADLIGPQPELEQLAQLEKKNRFKMVFQNFIQVFTKKEHPLVLFLDDLQWVDSASLQLLKDMMTNPESQYLLIVGAFRDNEVPPEHSLLQKLDGIRKENASVFQLTLTPLDKQHLNLLLADTFNAELSEIEPLSQLLLQKTNGNPFFVNQFLKNLYESKLLRFNIEQSIWTWDMDKILSQNISENVVDLMINRLRLLPEAQQRVLRLAACIGHQFDLQTLSVISEHRPTEVLHYLMGAIKSGFILPLDERYKLISGKESQIEYHVKFKFLHDRVQQAAYALIADQNKKQAHMTIGRLLLKKILPKKIPENVFHIIKHLNYSRDLLAVDEKNQLAELNLAAGIKAKESAAYEPALRYLERGISLLPENRWQEKYELSLLLYQEAANSAYLNGLFDKAFSLIDSVIQHGKTTHEKVRMYVLKMDLEAALLHTPQVLELGVNILEMLGIPLEKEAPKELNHDGLLNLPRMTDISAQAALPVLSKCVPAAYQSDINLLHRVVYTMVKLSVKYGNDPNSAFAYVMYGLILSGVPDTMEEGYQFGELGLKVMEKYQAIAIECRVKHIFNSHIRFTKDPLLKANRSMQEAIPAGLAAGDLEFVAYISNVRCLNLLFSDTNLLKVLSEFDQQVRLMKNIRVEHGATQALTFRQLILNLIGPSKDVTKLIGLDFDETEVLPKLKKVNQLNLIAYIYLSKLITCYIFGEKRTAFDHAKTMLTEGYDQVMQSMHVEQIFRFFCSLVILSQHKTLGASDKEKNIKQVHAYQDHMKMLSDLCPDNYQTIYTLIEAEKARVTGHYWQAVQCYDKAIRSAQKYQLVLFEAIANELYARFWMEKGKEEFAKLYLTKTHYCYNKWGARRKVEELEKEYPQLFFSFRSDSPSKADELDVSSIIKASQIISSEIDLKSLLSRIMTIIIKNAGAQKGVLVLDQNNELLIKAISLGVDDINVLQDKPIANSEVLPEKIVRLVFRTGENIILSDVFADVRFSKDAYIVKNQPKSIFSIPIRYRDMISGVLYLENSLTTDAFTGDRLQVISLLANQAGISLENARLFKEKHRHLEEIKKSEERFKSVFQQAAVGVARVDLDGTWLEVNEKFCDIVGYSHKELLSKTFQDITHPDDLQTDLNYIDQLLKAEIKTYSLEKRYFKKNGDVVWINLTVSLMRDQNKEPDYFVSIVEDITEKKNAEQVLKEMERRLQQSQKMESIGVLAGGIAHDFNNLLYPIIGFAEMLKEDLPSDSHEHESAQEIFNAGKRGGDLVKQILAFSRQTEHKLSPVRFQKILAEVLKLTRSTIPSDIEIHQDIQMDCGLVMAEATQLHQIAMNLITNAYHAVENASGIISVQLKEISMDGGELKDSPLKPGQYAMLSVSDNGFGIPRNVINNIFEPYFTTKEKGKGTGLGLAVVHGIVKEHKGDIKVYSEEGKGTTFNVYIPLMKKPTETVMNDPGSVLPTGTERILLVDDEESIVRLEKQMLERLGYSVSAFSNSLEGLETFTSNPDGYDLVISDMTMPNMTGDQLARELMSIRADIPIVICTGFSERINKEQAEANIIKGFLMKPIVKSEMAQMVRKVLDEAWISNK